MKSTFEIIMESINSWNINRWNNINGKVRPSHIILENAGSLPPYVIQSLINTIYPYIGNAIGDIIKEYSISNIQRINDVAMEFINKLDYPDDVLDTISNRKLFCILPYGNGDSAWYSFVTNLVVDYNYEINMFNCVAIKKFNRYDVWSPLPYIEWEKSIISGKHFNSWLNENKR